jgi:L-lactate utilization protein LutC
MNKPELYNLTKLYDMIGGYKKKYSSYENCKDDIISTTMKEYNKNKLKTRYGYPVTTKSQAIAIALNQTHSKCKYNKEEKVHLLNKVEKDFNNKNKEIILSNLVEINDAIVLLMNENKHKKAEELKDLLWNKIIDTYRSDNSLDMNMWDEIKKINDLF